MRAGEPVASGIAGVLRIPLASFPDERGAVFRMLRADDPHFAGFGEVYFSSVRAGVVKAWKRHHSLTASYACMHGLVRMVLYDGRPESPTEGALDEVLLGPDRYQLLVVPPGVWNGFQGIGEPESVVANCASEPYDPAEFDRVAPDAPQVPYRWGDAPGRDPAAGAGRG